jgi:hypothetical protein
VSTAIAAVLGVIAGALATGGIQATIARFDRKRAARASAALLGAQLRWAGLAIRAEHADLILSPFVNWERIEEAWEKHCASLALVLSAEDLSTVARAFTDVVAMAAVLRSRAKPTSPKEDIERTATFRQASEPAVTAAEEIVRRASLTWRERRRENEAAAST